MHKEASMKWLTDRRETDLVCDQGNLGRFVVYLRDGRSLRLRAVESFKEVRPELWRCKIEKEKCNNTPL